MCCFNDCIQCIEGDVISSVDEAIKFIKAYSDKGFYFRGERKDYGETSCLPSWFRKSNPIPNRDYKRLSEILDDAGLIYPKIPISGSDLQEIMWKALLSVHLTSYEKVFEKEVLEALIKHYILDFKKIPTDAEEILNKSEASLYLDITSDIKFALSQACSKHIFYRPDDEKKLSEEKEKAEKEMGDGYIYFFNVRKAKKIKNIKFIGEKNYSYNGNYITKENDIEGYKHVEGKEYFDRIMLQSGAFLAPKRNWKEEICYKGIKKDIKEKCLYQEFVIKSNVKKELLEYLEKVKKTKDYFPKLPLRKGGDAHWIQHSYEELEDAVILA